MSKLFYYTGKDYYKNDYVELYRRVSRWIKISYNLNGDSYFRHNNKRYKLDDFMRIFYPSYENMVITDTINIKDSKEVIQLSGYEADKYYKPLFIEISDCGDYVRLYRFEGKKE